MFIYSCTSASLQPLYKPEENALTPKLCFTFPQQKRLRHCRLLAKVCHAWRGAGAAQQFYPEQEDGVQRLQAVPVRPRAGWVAEHVYWPAVLKSDFESLAVANRLRKSQDLAIFFFFFEVSCCEQTEEKQTHRLHGVDAMGVILVWVCMRPTYGVFLPQELPRSRCSCRLCGQCQHVLCSVLVELLIDLLCKTDIFLLLSEQLNSQKQAFVEFST